ncbi:sensor histidine kinase [Kutzneria chonburiensis]|uniref:histidine kinase n=1 Tax=Kutzneria chonburiensis TaxID=1483604 RepID=A0ABV6MJG3_9PSEU|nr:HAMP domain-containing sensor histidine kinase [Kutzneria chonburiensis]
MSSDRRADRRPQWTLRRKLVVAVVLLLTVVSLAIGLTGELFIRRTLITQVNAQLQDAYNRSQHSPGGPGGHNPYCANNDLSFALPPGLGQGAVGVNHGLGVVLDKNVCPQQLDPDQVATLATVLPNGQAVTISVPHLGDYQVISNGDNLIGLPLDQVDHTLNSVNIALLVIAAAGLVVAATAGAVIIRAALRPLDRVAATATRVGELPLDRGEVALSVRVPDQDTDPRTEVGKVGAALNRMLGHVASALNVRQESETRVRQFVADASHELRTPLASIRGYAELAGRYSDRVPPDVSHAMRRIQSESTRMTSLVEELLLLARLDAGRPLASEPVDLSRLVVDAVSDARVTSRDHKWQLEIPGEPVAVLGDAQALHQVLLNLLGNARAHTPAGTTVVTGIGNGVPGEVVLTVADDGPGIPVALQPEVFERFARGDGSRSRASGGTGLGLSIVAAIVTAHGGEVALDSRPGRTVFTVRLTAAAQ